MTARSIMILLLFFTGILVVLAASTFLFFASAGDRALTSFELKQPLGNVLLEEFSDRLEQDLEASCKTFSPSGACKYWQLRSDYSVIASVEIKASENEVRLLVRSLPNHSLIGGPNSVSKMHRRIENMILEDFDGSLSDARRFVRCTGVDYEKDLLG